MGVVYIFTVLCYTAVGLTTASRCLTKYISGKTYTKYCYGGCCHYNTYVDPCCSTHYKVDIDSATISVGAVIGIVIGVLTLIAIGVSVICCCFCAACKRQASAGQVITYTQPNVAYTTHNQLAGTQGIPQQQQINGYGNSGYNTYTATQPPPYSQAVQTHP